MIQRLLIILALLFFCGTASAQTYAIGFQTGAPNAFSIDFNFETNPIGSTFGTRVSVGFGSGFGARVDGYYRLGFTQDSRSGLLLGISVAYQTFTLDFNNQAVRFQYITPSLFTGIHLEVLPQISLTLEGGLGLPIPTAISQVDSLLGFNGLLFTSLLASFRIQLGFRIYF